MGSALRARRGEAPGAETRFRYELLPSMHSSNGPSRGFLYPVKYSFIAVAVKFAAQDTAAPEPGVDLDDLVMSSNPFYGPAFATTATLIASAKRHCTQASQIPGAYTSFLCEFPESSAMVLHELRVDASQHHYAVMTMLSCARVDKMGTSYKRCGIEMDYDKHKVDDLVLALLYLGTFSERSVRRAWKSFDWDALDRLHAKGYISNPKNAAKSVVMSDSGAKLAESLFKKHFGIVD